MKIKTKSVYSDKIYYTVTTKPIIIIMMILNTFMFATAEDILDHQERLNEMKLSVFNLSTNEFYFLKLPSLSSLKDAVPDEHQHLSLFVETAHSIPKGKKNIKFKDIRGSEKYCVTLCLSRDNGFTSYFNRSEICQKGETCPPREFINFHKSYLIKDMIGIIQNSDTQIKDALSCVGNTRTIRETGEDSKSFLVYDFLTFRIRSSTYTGDDSFGEIEFEILGSQREGTSTYPLKSCISSLDEIFRSICNGIKGALYMYPDIYYEYLRTQNEGLKELVPLTGLLSGIRKTMIPETSGIQAIKLSRGLILALEKVINLNIIKGLIPEEYVLQDRNEDQTQVLQTSGEAFLFFQQKILPVWNKLKNGRHNRSWSMHIEKVLECLDIVLLEPVNQKVFYIDSEGLVEKSKKSMEELKKIKSKNNKLYAEQDLLQQLQEGYTLQEAWCTKEDGVWKFMAHLQEPKEDKVNLKQESPEPQISPSSSSSSSQGPAIETQEEVVIQEDLSHLLTIENEAQKAIYTLGYRLNRVNEKQMDQMKINIVKDEIFVRKGYDQYPIYAGFIQQVLKGEEVTLGKSESNYVYKQMLDFAKSIEKQFPEITVHYPRQCPVSQKVYLVSDKKSHIYFVCLPKKGEPYVMKQIPERSI